MATKFPKTVYVGYIFYSKLNQWQAFDANLDRKELVKDLINNIEEIWFPDTSDFITLNKGKKVFTQNIRIIQYKN